MKLVADIDAIDPVRQTTALCEAAQDESADAFDMVQALVLKHGADPNVPDTMGLSPLHYASANGNLAVVQFLVTHGADIDSGVGTEASLTPLYMAYQSGRDRVAEYLKLFGAAEIEESVRMNLEVLAAINEANERFSAEFLVERLEEGDSPNKIVRILISGSSMAAIRTLRSQGRHDEAEMYRKWIELVPEVLDELPELGEDIDSRTFILALMQATFQKLASQPAPSSRSREDSTQ